MGWQTVVAVQVQAGNTIINPNGAFVYSSAPAAGNLVASIAPVSGTDQFGNAYLAGTTTYAATFATSLQSGFVAFYAGSLAGGWGGALSSVSGDVAGNVQVNAGGELQLIAAAGMTIQGGHVIPDTTVNPGHQSAAPAAYSQSYEQASTNRINQIMDRLAEMNLWPF